MIRLAAVIALGWSGASVLTAAAWSVLRAAEKRHNDVARANARAGLAAMGVGCPAVALAVADWLEEMATDYEPEGDLEGVVVARSARLRLPADGAFCPTCGCRAYLGEDA